jgi:hypothetical protein
VILRRKTQALVLLATCDLRLNGLEFPLQLKDTATIRGVGLRFLFVMEAPKARGDTSALSMSSNSVAAHRP